MTRWISFLTCLAVAGCLCSLGCEGEKPSNTPPPDKKAPGEGKPTPPPAPTAPEKKTSDAATGAANSALAGINAAAKEAAAATTCGKAGCSAPGKLTISCKSKDGKPVLFCCDNCMSEYKKANNIE